MTTTAATATDYQVAIAQAIALHERNAEFCRAQGKAAQVMAGQFPQAERTYTEQATEWYRRQALNEAMATAVRDVLHYAEA